MNAIQKHKYSTFAVKTVVFSVLAVILVLGFVFGALYMGSARSANAQEVTTTDQKLDIVIQLLQQLITLQTQTSESSSWHPPMNDTEPTVRPTIVPTAQLALAPDNENFDIGIKATETVPAGCWVSGDVKINGTVLYDNDSATALVVVMDRSGSVYAEWAASVHCEPLDEDSLASNVIVKHWPEGSTSSASVGTSSQAITQGHWRINKIDVANDPIVDAWFNRLRDPAPELWPTFPNVPNQLVPDFRVVNGNQVPDGVEYGQDDSPFCEQDQRCDWVVPAWHYRLISGDYSFHSDEFSYECRNDDADARKGCLIILFNVMNESYTWRDQSVDNGFTVMGRYWNGDVLEWAAWGLTSHAAANMLNMPTMRNPNTGDVLNAGPMSTNAGANCGVQPDACPYVDTTIVVHAGDRILAVAQTEIFR